MQKHKHYAFTLIELSVVLAIIGLLIGGVLFGKDLIAASMIRTQISQIEKYQLAVRAFQGKYGCLPGDCAKAADYGFNARGVDAGQGDDNGLIQGYNTNVNTMTQYYQAAGEVMLFWGDLSQAKLIDETYTGGSATVRTFGAISCPLCYTYFPKNKLNNGMFYVYSTNNINYLAMYGLYQFNSGGYVISNPILTVQQALQMDTKIDDGFPKTGKMINQYIWGTGIALAGTGWNYPTNNPTFGDPASIASSATSCYDNDGINNTTYHYSTSANSLNLNCSPSFQFQ